MDLYDVFIRFACMYAKRIACRALLNVAVSFIEKYTK